MRISHGTRIKNIATHNGYGYATDRMASSLRRLGHTFEQNDPAAPVQIWFEQPHHWKWNDSDQYRIGYHPWESTKLKDDWVERMNQCHEIWTPSPLIAEWYEADGVKPPIYVYEHGVDHEIWTPKKRSVSDTFNFLHVGGEAVRKGGNHTVRAFIKAFPDRDDVKLIMKQIPPAGFKVGPRQGKITDIFGRYDIEQMVDLFHNSHAYIYPSRGEGFGLTPLQAMATGMPTITLPAWAPYKHHLDPNLSLPSTLRASPHAEVHPGKMFYPLIDDIVDRMRWVVDNYDAASDFAMNQVPAITDEYDWDKMTKKTFDALEKRLS